MASKLTDYPVQPEREKMRQVEFGLMPLLVQDAPIDAKELYLSFDEDLDAAEGKYAYYRFEVSGIASKVQMDVHNKPSIELSDTVGGKCYALCIFNSDEIFRKVSVGDRVVCRGNYLVASSLFGIVLKNNEVIEGGALPLKNGKEIHYRDESILEIYDTETDTRTVAKEFPYLIEAPNWTPDGKALVYNSNGRIYRFDLETEENVQIDTGYACGCNNDHVISADGRFIAVSHRTKEDGESRIYSLPLSGGVPRLVTPMAPSYLHGWSPDGRTFCYCARRGEEYDIYTIPAGGGEEVRLTDAPGLNDGPEYDSEGEYIWFNSVRTGLMQAWRMRADGSEQTQMTFDTEWNTWFPHISPDRKKVVTISYKRGDLLPHEHLPHKNVELRLMNADGSNVRTIVKLFGGQGTINVNSWSPDSRKFAFVSYRLVEV